MFPRSKQYELFRIIFINLIPIAGVLFLGWNPGFALLFYIADSVIFQFFNSIKFWLAKRTSDDVTQRRYALAAGVSQLFTTVMITLVHGLACAAMIFGISGLALTPGEVDELFYQLRLLLGGIALAETFRLIDYILLKGYVTDRAEDIEANTALRVIYNHAITFIGVALSMFLGSIMFTLVFCVIKFYLDYRVLRGKKMPFDSWETSAKTTA